MPEVCPVTKTAGPCERPKGATDAGSCPVTQKAGDCERPRGAEMVNSVCPITKKAGNCEMNPMSMSPTLLETRDVVVGGSDEGKAAGKAKRAMVLLRLLSSNYNIFVLNT
jgi:hypothetical protein